jgi:hypothetical protein
MKEKKLLFGLSARAGIFINRPGLNKLHLLTSVVEPDLEPQGAGTFSQSRSWSRYTEVSAPAPGQTKEVYLIIIHIE